MQPVEAQQRSQPASSLFEGQLSRVRASAVPANQMLNFAVGDHWATSYSCKVHLGHWVQDQPEPAPSPIPMDELLMRLFSTSAPETDAEADQGPDQGALVTSRLQWLACCFLWAEMLLAHVADLVEALTRSMEDDRPSARPPAAKYAIQQLKAYRYRRANRTTDLQCSVCQYAPAQPCHASFPVCLLCLSLKHAGWHCLLPWL